MKLKHKVGLSIFGLGVLTLALGVIINIGILILVSIFIVLVATVVIFSKKGDGAVTVFQVILHSIFS